MQFDRNSSRFYEIFYLVGNDAKFSSPVFHWTKPIPCFQTIFCFNFFRFSEFAIPRNISYVFFFLTPLCRLWSLCCRNSPKVTNSGSPLYAIFLLTNWFEEPIELQDLLHIEDGRCQLYGNHRYCGVL